MQKLSVRVIMSAPYHPETQGKVERSHRSFRIKLKFDLVTFKKRGVNWVNNLQRYAASLNDDAREELKWRTPFEVYFGRKNNILVAPLRVDPNAVCTENRRPGPTKTSDYDKFNDCQNKIRKAAGKASKRCADRMVKRSSRKNPPSIYNAKDRVLIRLKDRKHHVPRKYHVLPGTVLEANYKSNRYRVQFISPQTDRLTSQWFPVTDITSTTNLKERQRKLQSQKVQHRKKYIIELTHSDRISAFGIGLSVRLDPVGDGNCQFAAFADQLNLAGIHRSAATLRDEIVQDLRRNPFNQAGIHLGHYVDRNDWEHYLNHMEVEGSYGDHLTIQRASEIFNVYIVIYSSLGPQGTNVISPNGRFERGLPTMFLGHLAEEQGEHYLSLTNPGLDSVDNELNRFRNQTHTDSHPVNTQSPPCAASFDQVSTESTVIPSIYQQSPPCAASLDQQSPIVIPERHELPHLPPEILKIILQRTLELDCTMIGIFEQVSDHFKELVSHMRPLLHIGDSLAERLGIVACREKCVSVRSIHRAAGRNSGLVQLIRKLLRENIKNWMNAWLMLTAEDYSKYSISHIFRK